MRPLFLLSKSEPVPGYSLPDEREVIRCLRAIDDEEYRKRFLLLLKSAANKG